MPDQVKTARKLSEADGKSRQEAGAPVQTLHRTMGYFLHLPAEPLKIAAGGKKRRHKRTAPPGPLYGIELFRKEERPVDRFGQPVPLRDVLIQFISKGFSDMQIEMVGQDRYGWKIFLEKCLERSKLDGRAVKERPGG